MPFSLPLKMKNCVNWIHLFTAQNVFGWRCSSVQHNRCPSTSEQLEHSSTSKALMLSKVAVLHVKGHSTCQFQQQLLNLVIHTQRDITLQLSHERKNHSYVDTLLSEMHNATFSLNGICLSWVHILFFSHMSDISTCIYEHTKLKEAGITIR